MIYLGLLALAALDAAGYSVIAPVVPAIAAQTGAGPAVAGALVATFAVGQVVGYPVAGRVFVLRNARAVLALGVALVVLGDLGFIAGAGLAVYFPARLLHGIGAGCLWLGVTLGVLERFPGEEFRRLTGVLASYSVGGVAGPAFAAVGGVRGPFLLHLCAVVASVVPLLAIGGARARASFAADRSALRTPGFLLASAGIILVAIGWATMEGPIPIHFAERLGQAEIAGLFVGGSILVGTSAAVVGSRRPRPLLALAAVLLPVGLGLAGLGDTVPEWIVAVVLAAVAMGIGESGALGVLLETVGAERIVVALVVWSQLWAVGFVVGPAVSGAVAEALGFAAIGLVPLAAALVVALLFVWAPASFVRPAAEPGDTEPGAFRDGCARLS